METERKVKSGKLNEDTEREEKRRPRGRTGSLKIAISRFQRIKISLIEISAIFAMILFFPYTSRRFPGNRRFPARADGFTAAIVCTASPLRYIDADVLHRMRDDSGPRPDADPRSVGFSLSLSSHCCIRGCCVCRLIAPHKIQR